LGISEHHPEAESLDRKRLLVVGGTGRTGRLILDAASAAGLSVRALARDPASLSEDRADVEVCRGDVLDIGSLAAALTGVDAVVSALGTKLELRPVTVLSQGTGNLIAAMTQAGIARLICITGVGAGDSRGHGGVLYDRLWLPTLLRQVYADKDRQERAIRDSGLDWTIVRPARLADHPARGRYRTITSFNGERMKTISRADVAAFIVDELREHQYSRQTVNLTD